MQSKNKDDGPLPTDQAGTQKEDENANLGIGKRPMLGLYMGPQSTNLLPQEVIRSEVNFLIFPFFALSRRDAAQRLKTEYRTVQKRGNETLNVYWGVHGHPRYGYPRPFDGRVHKAIEQIISELRPPLENPVPLGSLYRIAQLLHLTRSGRAYSDIKGAIQRIVATIVESKGAFYHKAGRRWIEDTFHLYDRAVFTGETLPGGEVADTNYLFLSSWYLDNLNQRHVKPLDYTYYRSLRSPIACRLYELLGVKFYGMGHHPFIRYRYSNLCQLLPVKQYRYASDAKRNLHTAHQELIRTGFLFKVEWDDVLGEVHDWYVSYWPGPKAHEEIQRLPRQLPLTIEAINGAKEELSPLLGEQYLDDDQPVATASQTEQRRTKRKKLAQDQPELTQTQQELLNHMEEVGVTRRTAKSLVRRSDPQVISNWLKVIEHDENIQDRPAYLVKALREDWQLPESFHRKEEARREAELKEQGRQLSKNCAICEGTGYYQVAENTMSLCQHNGRRGPKKHKPEENDLRWKQVLESLRAQTTPSTYEMRLKDTKLLGLDGNTAIIGVEDKFSKEWLERRLYQAIVRALEQVLDRQQMQVEFLIAPP